MEDPPAASAGQSQAEGEQEQRMHLVNEEMEPVKAMEPVEAATSASTTVMLGSTEVGYGEVRQDQTQAQEADDCGVVGGGGTIHACVQERRKKRIRPTLVRDPAVALALPPNLADLGLSVDQVMFPRSDPSHHSNNYHYFTIPTLDPSLAGPREPAPPMFHTEPAQHCLLLTRA